MPKPTFTTVSPGGLTVEIRIMPENQWWFIGSRRNKLALVSHLGESRMYSNFKPGHSPVIAGLTRLIPNHCGSSRRRYNCDPGWPGIQTGTHRGFIRDSVN
jgi:hypothetical protein